MREGVENRFRICPHAFGVGNARIFLVPQAVFRCPRCEGTGEGAPYVEGSDGSREFILMSDAGLVPSKTVVIVKIGS